MGTCQDSVKVLDELATDDGQSHLMNHWNNLLTSDKRRTFENQLNKVNVDRVLKIYKKSSYSSGTKFERMNSSDSTDPNLPNEFHPISDERIIKAEDMLKNKAELDEIGLQAIKEGKVGIVLMAGGQSPQLNLDCSLGIYDIGLDCNCSLFEIFIQKLSKLCRICLTSSEKMVKIYIMTNSENKEDIKAYFKNKNYFDYGSENIFFFSQETEAVVDENGKIVLKGEGNIYMCPRGNGSIYKEIKSKKLMSHMESKGIKYVFLNPINNVLLKIGDPTSLGYLVKENKDVVATCIQTENQCFGFFGETSKGNIIVNEDKIPNAEKKWANTGSCLMTFDFLSKIVENETFLNEMEHKLHDVAKDIITYDAGKNTKTLTKCLLFESFYHQAFRLSDKISVFEVIESEEFAPIQSSDETRYSITQARNATWNLHRKYFEKVKVELKGKGHIEIHPSLTYEGEGIEEIMKEKGFKEIQLPEFIF